MKIAPYDKLMTIDDTIWTARTTHTSVHNPSAFTKVLITGNDTNTGIDDAIPIRKVVLEPRESLIRAKKKIWNRPLKMPNAERMFPMNAGDSPSPPSSTGIDMKTG